MEIRTFIPETPHSWERLPLKAVASCVVSSVDKLSEDGEAPIRLCNYRDVYNNEFIRSSMDFMAATATESEIERFRLFPGDVVITKDSESWDDIAVPSLVLDSADDLLCGYHLAILRPDQRRIRSRFLFRCFQSKTIRLPLELASTGVTRFGLPKDEIGRLILPVPPIPEQEAIADYLDRETARIDELIAEKEKMLALLEEKRNALITRAVTRGLNPKAKMKESGCGWLEEIPIGWQTRRVAFLFQERDERNEPDLPLLNVSLNTGVTVREFSDDRIERMAEDFATYKIARKGDVAFNKMRMWQGAVGIAPGDGLVSPDYVVAKPGSGVLPNYFGFLFRIQAFGAEAARRSHGIVWDRLRLYWDDFRDIRVPVPPLDEQRAIVEALNAELSGMRELETALKQSIALLSERRTALITAAVTGQMDVAGAAA